MRDAFRHREVDVTTAPSAVAILYGGDEGKCRVATGELIRKNTTTNPDRRVALDTHQGVHAAGRFRARTEGREAGPGPWRPVAGELQDDQVRLKLAQFFVT